MRDIGDYPGVSKAHMNLAKKYSSILLIGPPMCNELVSLVEHMFSEEEAEVARHLKPWRPMTAKKPAAATELPLREVEAILDVLAHCRYPIHTSVLEGINNKIKVIKRVSYGYRDEEYFFLKIRGAFRLATHN
jgi:Transposase